MDTALIVVLLLCQALTGGLGFYVSIFSPSKKQRTLYLLAFAGLTLLGVAVGAISGIRAAVAFEQMNKQLAWNDRPPVLQLNRPLELILPHDSEGFHVNIHFENSGGRAAQNYRFLGRLIHHEQSGDINRWIEMTIARLWPELAKKKERAANEVQAGDGSKFFSMPDNYLTKNRITQSQLDAWLRRGPFYMFVLFSWHDPKTGDLWKSESCYIWKNGSAPGMCDGHNRVIRPDQG